MLPFIHVPMAPLQTVTVQARTEARDTHGTDPNDLELEVAPLVRYDAIWDHAQGHFVALYNPHLTYASADSDSAQTIDGKSSFLQLHSVNTGLELERQRYHITSYGNLAYGPVSSTALLAAFTKPWLGEGLPPSPNVIIPAKFGSVGPDGHISTTIFTLLFAQAQLAVPVYLTHRLTLTPLVTYSAFGGADSASRLPLPMVRGPGGSLTLEAKATRQDVFKSKIGGGHASISMGAGDPDTQLKNAEKLEMVLRSGALPAPISPSNESLIGPTLGADAIRKGALGALGGAGLVLMFMMFYYRKAGFVADGAVLFNLLIQLAILAALSGTLTLPGIAGLALTIGMAVDANVLINERIREELRGGRSIRAAVEAGYDKAFTAIIDGHVTIFISGLILSQYGTGPVKGFAYTLIIGIIASLFTGVFCTRLVFDYWVRGAKAKRLSVGAEF